jgi:hypothetical protein
MKRLVALALPLVVLLAACGGSGGPDPQANPKDALVSAFENMSGSDGLQIVLSLDSDVDSLVSTSEGDLAEEDAQKILDSSLTVRTRGSGDDAQAEFVATIAGEDDVTIKVVDKVLYAQLDVEGLMETFGGDPADLDLAAQQAEAQGLGFVRNAIDGDWIALTGLEEMAKQFGGTAGGQITPDQQKVIEDMTTAIEESADVTHEGSDDAGDHLVVSLPLRDLYSEVMSSIQGLAGSIPMGELPPASEIPEGNLELDVWVADDRVTQVVFDFVKAAQTFGEEEIPEGVGSLGLKLELDEFGDDIEVPEDAVEVDGQQLMQTFMGAMMGSMGASEGAAPAPSTSFDCSQLEGAPQDVLDQFADVCPNL